MAPDRGPRQRIFSKASQKDLEEKPWRYIGYEGFSEWSASDNDFFIVRRFDNIASRVILLLQWDLTQLEEELKKLDSYYSEDAGDVNNGSFKFDPDERQLLLRKIKGKLKEYYHFVSTYSALRARPEASDINKQKVENWLYTYDGAVDEEEIAFISGHADLFSVVEWPRTPLRTALEKVGAFLNISYFLRTPENLSPLISKKGTTYYSNPKVDSFVNLVICIAGFLMLAVPLWILYFVTSQTKQLIVITIFIGAFLALVQAVSVARPFETLAATAAYSAVLMVFMQIGR